MEPKKPFELIVREHGSTVFRVCRAVLGPHDAEDGWSETFLSALRAYPELPVGANVEAWLVTIAHHKSIDIVRARNRQPVPLDVLPVSPSGLGIPGDGHAEVFDAVGQLPPKQRQAVAYHYFAGLPYKDVAALLGGTPDAARRAGADGVKALRTILDDSSVKEETP